MGRGRRLPAQVGSLRAVTNFTAATVLVLGLVTGSIARAEVNEQGYEIVPVETRAFDADDVEAGRISYEAFCTQCHGPDGAGAGTMADLVHPRPRDFTRGVYKLRHTASDQLPTDQDLFSTISLGMPGSSMPGWGDKLTEEQIWQLVGYIKAFSGDFTEFPAEEQFLIGEPSKSSPESIQRGAAVYGENQCAKCHGEKGRGDGPSANELVDGWGYKIWPADLSKSWTFRGGNGPQDIYRTFVTGLAGTPMPSFAQSITSEDAWHLTNYVMSLARPPVRDVVVRGARVTAIPTDPYAPEWEQAPNVDFLLAGQIIVEPRLFMPLNREITVKALYDEQNVALLLIWSDRIENRGEDASPPDQIAVQFPAEMASDNEKPYFLMGDPAHPVNFWLWSARDRNITSLLARGLDDVEPGSAVLSHSDYRLGEYRVIMSRRLTTDSDLDTPFAPGRFIPVAFHLWSGENHEEGKKRAISAWYYLLLEPETPNTVFAWPGIIVFLGLGAEVFMLRRLNRTK